MVGGMVSSTILTLIVIPAIYGLVKEFGVRKEGMRAGPAVQRGSTI
jgi:Cu(I)/Ag(I) efflux system membrane protein CusA/SilA